MNLFKKIILGTSLTGILLLDGCEPATEQEPTGDIFGSIYWDIDGDGIFEGTRLQGRTASPYQNRKKRKLFF